MLPHCCALPGSCFTIQFGATHDGGKDRPDWWQYLERTADGTASAAGRNAGATCVARETTRVLSANHSITPATEGLYQAATARCVPRDGGSHAGLHDRRSP